MNTATKFILTIALLVLIFASAYSLLAQGSGPQQKEERTFKNLIVELELDPVSKNKTLKDGWDQREKELLQLKAQRISLLINRDMEASKDKPDPEILKLVNSTALAALDAKIEATKNRFRKLLVSTLSEAELFKLLSKIGI